MAKIVLCTYFILLCILAAGGLYQWQRDDFDEIDDREEWCAAHGVDIF